MTIDSRLGQVISSNIRIALAVFTPLQYATMTARSSPSLVHLARMAAAGAFPRPGGSKPPGGPPPGAQASAGPESQVGAEAGDTS